MANAAFEPPQSSASFDVVDDVVALFASQHSVKIQPIKLCKRNVFPDRYVVQMLHNDGIDENFAIIVLR